MTRMLRLLLLLVVVAGMTVVAGAESYEAATTSSSPDFGGAANSSAWANGPPAGPNYFPIGVWLQGSRNIVEFRTIGINLFVGTADNFAETTLATFAHAAMPLITEQTPVALASQYRRVIIGWLQPDEQDNAQPNGRGGYGSCIAPAEIVARYVKWKSADASRPVLLGFGRGVADTQWTGRHDCTGQTTSYYPLAVGGGDIVSFDIFPIAGYQGRLELVARGLDNLHAWIAEGGRSRIVWNAIEAVPIGSGAVPTPAEERAEVWMSIIHGSRGIVYFVHQFSADGSHLVREDGIFNFPVLVKAVSTINAELNSLAPIINAPDGTLGIHGLGPGAGAIDTMARRYKGAMYLFTICMRAAACGRISFVLPEVGRASAQVIDENRTLNVANGIFDDDFAGYGVHLYRVTAR
jgi:hypothetical protein